MQVSGEESEYLVESKATDKEGYRITKEVLEKIEKEAIRSGKTPLLLLELGKRKYVVLRLCDFEF